MKHRIKALLSKLENVEKRIKRSVTKVLHYLQLLVKSVFVVFVLVFIGAKAPEIHSTFIRYKVGAKVYDISGAHLIPGGGTGFAVKGKSGQTYIVSNAHVCNGATPDGHHVFVKSEDGRKMWRRILEISENSDLCLIEAMPGTTGLSIGFEPAVGQIVASVGHPSGRPITLSKGEIIGTKTVSIPSGVIVAEDNPLKRMIPPEELLTEEQCSMPKNKKVKQKVNTFFFQTEITICLEVTKNAYTTNILVQPGNSGSPVVNFWGNVVGVVFAMDPYGWSSVVSIHDLKEFLSNY